MKRKIVIAFCFAIYIGSGSKVNSQNFNPLNLTNINPATPEVSAITKYTDIPVGQSSGVPPIQIPFYTAVDGPISIPIGLSYHAGGIKVPETPTWIGLGWNLNAGASISRSVRGLPDDFDVASGYLYTQYTVPYIMATEVNSTERSELLVNRICNEQNLDAEPDIFSFSALGYSGKFYYHQKLRQFVQTPQSAVRIDTACNSTKQINGFILTLPNGVKCYFGLSADKSRQAWDNFQSQHSISFSESSGFSLPSNGFSTPHISSWHLLEVRAPAGNSIELYYTSYNSVDFGRGGESVEFSSNGSSCNYEGTELTTGKKSGSFYEQLTIKSKLTKISTELVDVWFKSNTHLRQDVMADEYALDTILVKRKDNSLIKGVVFDYSYFTSTNVSGTNLMNYYPLYNDPNTVYHKRLRLNTVKEFALGDELPPYRFYYDTTFILPDRLSSSQDFWGYYNGESNGLYTIPSVPNSLINSGATGMTNGADRTVNFTYAKSCVLNKIIYPTGGSTQYTYESNTANTTGFNLGVVGYQYSGLINKFYSFGPSPNYYHNTTPFETYVDSFTVGVISGQVHLITTGCANYNSLDCPFSIQIKGITDPNFTLGIGSGDFNASIPVGKYKITTTVRDPSEFTGFEVILTWQQFDPSGGSGSSVSNTLVGGLRVRKITSRDSVGGSLTRTYSYTSFSDPTKSSGSLIDIPIHAHYVPCGYGGMSEEPSLTAGVDVLGGAGVLKIASYNVLPACSSTGQSVRYLNVTEYQDANVSSHKTEYTFSDDYFNFVSPSTMGYPFPQNVQRSWQKDLLLNQKKYVNTGPQSYRLLEEQKNFYTEFEQITNDSFGLAVNSLPYSGAFIFSYYKFVSEWHLLDSTIISLYSSENDGTIPIVQSRKFYYTPANSYTVSIERSVNSRGQVTDSKIWYPHNYNNISGSNIDLLKQKNIIDAPLRQEISKNGKLVQGQVITYHASGKPKEVYRFESAQPVDTTTHNPAVIIPSLYTLLQTGYYNEKGEIREVDIANDITRSFIWDYANTSLVATVSNADTASISYTSFEAEGSGTWTIPSATRITGGITGNKCYQLSNGSITRNNLNTSVEYVVTYWTTNISPFTIAGTQGAPVAGRSVGEWRYFMHRITGVSQITFNENGLIDELRFYPKGAQMTTYTYDPLIGITSQCDVANKIVYYEYDSFGRLKLIRDQDKNILKTFGYKFQENTNQ